MEKVKLGMIGIGNMGSGHIQNILAGKTPEIEVAAAADRREERRAWAKKTLPEGTPVFTEGSELIESGLCDAVLIATPHYQHPVLAREAFQKGLHVLCEKPAGVGGQGNEPGRGGKRQGLCHDVQSAHQLPVPQNA